MSVRSRSFTSGGSAAAIAAASAICASSSGVIVIFLLKRDFFDWKTLQREELLAGYNEELNNEDYRDLQKLLKEDT